MLDLYVVVVLSTDVYWICQQFWHCAARKITWRWIVSELQYFGCHYTFDMKWLPECSNVQVLTFLEYIK